MNKIFNIIYLVFSIFLILFTFVDISSLGLEYILKIISLILVCLLLIIYKKSKFFKKIKISDDMFFYLMLIGIGIRFIVLFLEYGSLFADYANFYNDAKMFYEGKGISSYTATFPHLIPYIVMLANLFKIFGINYKVVVGVNILFDLLVFFVLKKYYKDNKLSLLWLFCPINILWCGMCHTVVITNSLLVISFVLFDKLINNIDNNKKLMIIVILFSVVLSIANLFRPIMIVVLIALFIFLLFRINNKNKIIKYIIIYGCILLVYIGCNKIYFNLEKKFIDDSISSVGMGWNLYVGSNVDSNGTWNIEQQSEFSLISIEKSPTEVQEYFFDKSIDAYIDNGLVKNMKLFWNKSVILVGEQIEFSCLVFDNSLMKNMDKTLFYFIYFISSIFHYFLLVINLLVSYISIKIKKIDYALFIQLFVIGVVSSHLLVEVSPRYSMSLFVGYIFIVILNVKNIRKLLK